MINKTNISRNAGIYIHVPFCDTKCGYCDFYSITNQSSRPQYVQALLKEIALYARPPFATLLYDTIYFGGGTPSLLEPGELSDIMTALYANFHFSPNCEITLEANPGTLTMDKIREIKKQGVNRISLGIQSFDDGELKTLGRIHDAQQARDAFYDLRAAGIGNISIDLIYALPGQRLDRWQKNIQAAVELKPEHISAYNLIYEEGTPFYKKLQKKEFTAFPSDEELKYFNETLNTLSEAGYLQYEVSNYARGKAFYSRHNYKYWTHTPFLGFGPAAYAFYENERWGNFRSIKKYITALETEKVPVHFRETLNKTSLAFEQAMLGLRTRAGINLEEYEKLLGETLLHRYKKQIRLLLDEGFAEMNSTHLYLTDRGFLISDEILPAFAPE